MVVVDAFHHNRIHVRPLHRFLGKQLPRSIHLYSSVRNNSDDDSNERQQQRQTNYERVQRAMMSFQQRFLDSELRTSTPALLRNRFLSPSKLVPLQFRNDGYVELPSTVSISKGIIAASTNNKVNLQPQPTSSSSSSMIQCLVLQKWDGDETNGMTYVKDRKSSQPSLLIPLLDRTDWWLLTQLPSISSNNNNNNNVMTKFDLRRQNSIIINHPSNGLYDNLPYHWYNTDKSKNNNNNDDDDDDKPLLPQQSSSFGGKRECYNILLGKDWYLWNTNSPSLASPSNDEVDETNTESATESLQSRIGQLQRKELESQLAECDSEIAYLLQQQQRQGNDEGDPKTISSASSSFTDGKDLQYWQQQRDILLQVFDSMTVEQEEKMQVPKSDTFSLAAITSNAISTLQRNIGSIFDNNARPPKTNSPKSTMSAVRSVVPYRNTYDMIHKRIIQDMLHADVVGCLLENTSLLDVGSGMTMGGLIILQKQPKMVKLFGESVPIPSSFDGINSDDICFVECHVDEAIGMSLSCKLPLWIAEETWKYGAVMCGCNPCQQQSDTDPTEQRASIWNTNDPELMILVEGQSLNASRTERVLPIRIPRITNLYDSVMMVEQQNQPTNYSSNMSKDLFPTDNIIQSLQQYDQMTIDDKARTFMAMSNTQQIPLPRRRLVEQKPQIIDDLLIPYIDESVRYEYNIRTAQQSGDLNRIKELEQQQSMLSKARMNRINAEDFNDDESKEYWDQEIEFYSSLRADVTQDVGTYSRFLDRDEWYERDRQRMVKRMLERQSNDQNSKT
jgi:hypothetical protein